MKRYPHYILVSITLIIIALIGRNALMNRNIHQNTITVTGLGKKDFTSDLIVWSGSFSQKNYDLKESYALLDRDRDLIKNYLVKQGIPANQIVFSSINITKDSNHEYNPQTGQSRNIFNGYLLTQNFQIESKDVDKIEAVSRKASEIINQGVEFYSNNPEYYYTKLAELKIEMIADATKDANLRAENIAKNANAKLGTLKKATMGVFQIIAQNSSEDYSWGGSYNTFAKNKTATITTRLEYQVK